MTDLAVDVVATVIWEVPAQSTPQRALASSTMVPASCGQLSPAA